jgi:hypothetical protein
LRSLVHLDTSCPTTTTRVFFNCMTICCLLRRDASSISATTCAHAHELRIEFEVLQISE